VIEATDDHYRNISAARIILSKLEARLDRVAPAHVPLPEPSIPDPDGDRLSKGDRRGQAGQKVDVIFLLRSREGARWPLADHPCVDACRATGFGCGACSKQINACKDACAATSSQCTTACKADCERKRSETCHAACATRQNNCAASCGACQPCRLTQSCPNHPALQ
jgi:hypothetical protein